MNVTTEVLLEYASIYKIFSLGWFIFMGLAGIALIIIALGIADYLKKKRGGK